MNAQTKNLLLADAIINSHGLKLSPPDKQVWFQRAEVVEMLNRALAQPVPDTSTPAKRAQKAIQLARQHLMQLGDDVPHEDDQELIESFHALTPLITPQPLQPDLSMSMFASKADYEKAVAEPSPIRVTDVEKQFPGLTRALMLWHLTPQKDHGACWNAFNLVEEELEKILNARFLQPAQPADLHQQNQQLRDQNTELDARCAEYEAAAQPANIVMK